MIDFNKLTNKSKWVWRETLKIHQRSKETRVASSLSPIEILTCLYYGNFIKYVPNDRFSNKRDRVIISKGHGSLCLYPIFADLGFFPMDELNRVCKNESFLGGIPDPIIPGYETVNGSLGHGVGVGCGISTALKLKNMTNKVIVLTGDGELHEGSNWEGFMYAAHHKLDNLFVIVDDNKISMLDHTKNIVDHIDIKDKFKSFGWNTISIKNGHDISEIIDAYKHAFDGSNSSPTAIIANTIKGNGVPGLQNDGLSHVLPIPNDVLNKLLEDA